MQLTEPLRCSSLSFVQDKDEKARETTWSMRPPCFSHWRSRAVGGPFQNSLFWAEATMGSHEVIALFGCDISGQPARGCSSGRAVYKSKFPFFPAGLGLLVTGADDAAQPLMGDGGLGLGLGMGLDWRILVGPERMATQPAFVILLHPAYFSTSATLQ
jgi:hypothetical protein